jgi:hypothetical protein
MVMVEGEGKEGEGRKREKLKLVFMFAAVQVLPTCPFLNVLLDCRPGWKRMNAWL